MNQPSNHQNPDNNWQSPADAANARHRTDAPHRLLKPVTEVNAVPGQRKTALITGASAGLGRHFAELFAADGHDLVLVARREDELHQLASRLQNSYGTQSTVIAADLTDPAAGDRLYDTVAGAGTSVEYLVNNAGFGITGAFMSLGLDRELDMIELNIKALTRLTGLFLPAMVGRGSGRILNVSSGAGFLPGPFMATYYASKAYVLHFSEALAYELRDSNVTVTALCPGPTATEFATAAGAQQSALFKGGGADAAVVAERGYLAMMAGKTIAVADVKTKVNIQALRLLPRALTRHLAAQLNRH